VKRSSNDPVNPDVIGASERDLRRASLAVWLIAIAAIVAAVAWFYALFAGP